MRFRARALATDALRWNGKNKRAIDRQCGSVSTRRGRSLFNADLVDVHLIDRGDWVVTEIQPRTGASCNKVYDNPDFRQRYARA